MSLPRNESGEVIWEAVSLNFITNWLVQEHDNPRQSLQEAAGIQAFIGTRKAALILLIEQLKTDALVKESERIKEKRSRESEAVTQLAVARQQASEQIKANHPPDAARLTKDQLANRVEAHADVIEARERLTEIINQYATPDAEMLQTNLDIAKLKADKEALFEISGALFSFSRAMNSAANKRD